MLGVLVVVGEERLHERAALPRTAIGGERLQLRRRRQQAPGVEIDAAREERVGHRRRLADMPPIQICADEAIERRRPAGPPNGGDEGALEPERRLPWLRRLRRRGCLPGPLIDPQLDQRNLRRRQRILILRHLGIGRAGEAMDDRTARAAGRPDHRAVPAAFQRVAVRGERQPAFPLVPAMALEAVPGNDRLDLALVIDLWRSVAARRRLRDRQNSRDPDARGARSDRKDRGPFHAGSSFQAAIIVTSSSISRVSRPP